MVIIEAGSGISLTAEALNEAALAFADRLPTATPGDRIAFRLPNGVEWMACFLALQKRGLTAVPLDHGLPAAVSLETARQIGARFLYQEGSWQTLRTKTVRRAGICCLKTTSGSAGVPKVIACRAEHLIADGEQIIRTMKIRPGDRNLAVIPLGHSYGLGNLVMPLILQGTAVVCAGSHTPRQLLEWIERHAVTVFPAVPALLRVLATLPAGGEKGVLASLRTVISAGAVLPAEVARAFFERFGRRIHNFYGSSETGGICYDRTGAATLSGRAVGRPLESVRVTIAKGRLTVASAAVATRTGRWRPEDRAEWNRDGELVLLGRGGPGANIGGRKVHPLEIEKALRALPGVTDAAVWRHHTAGRDALAAAVESVHAPSQLEHALAAKLPAWKLPRWYVVDSTLPRTARGKLDMAELRRRVH
jgi:acyl-coenzyme A synthetase/AMP-(fatty) acid ligase